MAFALYDFKRTTNYRRILLRVLAMLVLVSVSFAVHAKKKSSSEKPNATFYLYESVRSAGKSLHGFGRGFSCHLENRMPKKKPQRISTKSAISNGKVSLWFNNNNISFNTRIVCKNYDIMRCSYVNAQFYALLNSKHRKKCLFVMCFRKHSKTKYVKTLPCKNISL